MKNEVTYFICEKMEIKWKIYYTVNSMRRRRKKDKKEK